MPGTVFTGVVFLVVVAGPVVNAILPAVFFLDVFDPVVPDGENGILSAKIVLIYR